ncbi:MAG TPA: biotin--[acetyl-CoA-carboxylase] ligase, partial [Williamwhitmania sp.]|nr:biotin--[acetyl-CoA-carboxylase] ligase [Williamwhitmania sp.]
HVLNRLIRTTMTMQLLLATFVLLTNHQMSKEIKILKFPRVNSTNLLAQKMLAEHSIESDTVIWTLDQFGGRGQRENRWEVEPGQNLTFSLAFFPEQLAVNQQFSLSEATALGVLDAIASLIDTEELTIKWPNDIYLGAKKVGGLLLEHSIMGAFIETSVIGIGINVNQRIFPANLPNPTSLAMESGKEFDLEELLEVTIQHLFARYAMLNEHKIASLHEEYRYSLFRKEGYHTFETDKGQFTAKIADVKRTGELILEVVNGDQAAYAFKEVGYVL